MALPLSGGMTNWPEDNDQNDDDYRDWSHDLSALQEIGEELLEEWRAQEPRSARAYPSARWLTENGYSHLRWVLSEKHDMGTPEFFMLFTSSNKSEGYEWSIDSVATIERAKTYLDDRVRCRNWTASTKQTNRSQLNQVLSRFAEEYGDDNVLALANDPTVQPGVYDAFKQVVIDLRNESISDDSVHHYVRAAHRFLEWLHRSGRIEYDPMEELEEEFRWDLKSDPTPFTDGQVRRLWDAADTDEERMLVIGYCVWGLRTKELPAIHVDQFNLDHDNPVVEFREPDRKNGQGTVSLIFGLDALANLVEKRARQSDWNKYLYPSEKGDNPFLSAKQMRSKFTQLCERAGVTIDGDPGTPKHGRAFYYNILADAETKLMEVAEKIAEEQGGKDAESVLEHYLTEQSRQQYRQVFFRQRIRRILPEDVFSDDTSVHDTSLDDFR